MARKKKATRKTKATRKPTTQHHGFFDDLSPHTKQAITAVAFGVLGVFFVLALFDGAGMIGELTKAALVWLFGGGAYLAPLVWFESYEIVGLFSLLL